MAAAAWSCVLKMLQLAQRTSAPKSARVSIRTAVWMVMCREPEIRAPAKGLVPEYSLRTAISPGISCSAREISLRPKPAKRMSATLYSFLTTAVPMSPDSLLSMSTALAGSRGVKVPKDGNTGSAPNTLRPRRGDPSKGC